MARAPKPGADSGEISIHPVRTGFIQLCVKSESPLIFNRMAEKARRTLLLGGTRKTDADKAANLKHSPPAEYRASVYSNAGKDCKTRLCIPSAAFKGAMATAAMDLPGTKKTEINRLVWVVGDYIDVFGIPELLMSVVRSADINKTPDIRTRAIVRDWTAVIPIKYVQPKLNGTSIANLMAAAGILCGVGDFRQEKGKGNYGQFYIEKLENKEVQHLMKTAGRVAQDKALENPAYYDVDTQDLIEWFYTETQRLGRDPNPGPEKEAA